MSNAQTASQHQNVQALELLKEIDFPQELIANLTLERFSHVIGLSSQQP